MKFRLNWIDGVVVVAFVLVVVFAPSVLPNSWPFAVLIAAVGVVVLALLQMAIDTSGWGP